MEPNNENIDRACNIMRLYLDNRYPEQIENDVIGWLAMEFNRPEKAIALSRIFREYIRPDHNPDERAFRMYREMAVRLGFPETEKRYEAPRPRRSLSYMWRVAAVLIPVVVAVGGFWLWSGGLSERPVITAEAQGGVNRKITLPDGSEVWLRAGSTLQYPETFAGSRDVRLEGEAYFTVTPSDVPFTVHSDRLDVRVLGTEFNFSAFPEDNTASVKLYSGSVEASAEGKKAVMEPGHLLTYDNGTAQMSLAEDSSDPACWTRGILMFDNKTTGEMFRICERHFGVEIDADGLPDSGLRHSARFDAPGHTVEDVMKVLQILTKEFDYTIDNDTIKVTPKQQR